MMGKRAAQPTCWRTRAYNMGAKGMAGEGAAYFCMTVIGIGYLFPISAIWAAFDYWKVLFPDANIEFAVTGVYQVGSVATVALLSASKSVELGPRIVGGFCGQFACLAAILGFRWLIVPATSLYNLLLGVVLLCSVATGYLDSALLALCSQYSPKMQQYLQIGIGFGTLVSVLYRDCTKLVLSGDVADATSAYFCVALLTVLICISCYKLLMRLPVSRHIAGSLSKSLLGTPPASPSPFIGTFTPVTPPLRGGEDLSVEEGQSQQAAVSLDGVEKADGSGAAFRRSSPGAVENSFVEVIKQVWKNQLVIFLNFFLTTMCYPGLITSIPCRQLLWLKDEHWFQTLLLTWFTLADIIARFLTHFRMGLTHENIGVTVIIRAFFLPLMIYCAAAQEANDYLSFAVVAGFGFLNGYCVSLSLIVVNEIPEMTDEQRKTCGRISACSVNSGLCVGSLAAGAVASTLGLSSG